MDKNLIDEIKGLKVIDLKHDPDNETIEDYIERVSHSNTRNGVIQEVVEVIRANEPKVLDMPDSPGAWLRLGEEWNFNEQKWESKWIATEVYRRPAGKGSKPYFMGNMGFEYELKKWKWRKIEVPESEG